MSPSPSIALTDSTFQLSFLLVLLIPLAIGGLALLNAGLGRSHSAAHAMLASLSALCVAAVIFLFLGSHIETQPGYTLLLSGKIWNWAGYPVGNGLDLPNTHSALTALFQVLAVSLAALAPLSAGADRWRLGATCLSTAILAGLIYPLFAHWTGAEGWLAQLGVSYGLGRGFLDAGGAGSIHAIGGIGALVVTWLLGPRRNKYQGRGIVAAIPGHNIVLVLSGCLLLLPGWIGLNAASTILFGTLSQTNIMSAIVKIALNTLLSGAGGSLAALVLTRVRFGKPDASLTANGWVAGLVAGSAACNSITLVAALATGFFAGILVVYIIQFLELQLFIDDPAGAISVHGVAGVWGLLSMAIFTPHTLPGQAAAQIVGIATLLGCILPAMYLLNWCADRLYRFRVDDDGERQGMDLRELGAGAYPEFVVHRDEFTQR